MALTICEDAWNDKLFWPKRLYMVDPIEALVRAGGNFVLNISASPFWIGKREVRRDMLASIARQHKVPVAMVNQVGGNDSLLFDGSSIVLNAEGKIIAQGRSFEEDLIYFDSKALTGDMHEQIEGEEASVYSALVLGTRDYIRKCGFQQSHHRTERRDRFGAHRGDCGGCGGTGECDWRGDAGALLFAGIDRRCARVGARIWEFGLSCFRSTMRRGGVPGNFAGCVCESEGRCDRGEYSVARAWHAADGALE